MDAGPRRPTSADVAREARVSRATVSYVLNQNPDQSIPVATQQRVRDAAARLGYVPSSTGRALRAGRTNLVLCVLPEWALGPAQVEGLRLQTEAFERRGLVLLTYYTRAGSDALENSTLWSSLNPAAVLMFDDVDPRVAARLARSGVEHVVGFAGGGDTRALQIDESMIGVVQAEHLADLGHRQLGYALPVDQRMGAFADIRLRGVRATCARRGLPDPVVVETPVDSADAGHMARALTTQGVSGICAFDDLSGLAFLSGAHVAGVRVPEDLAVVGVDDSSTARLTEPPLTSVLHDFADIAEFIAEGVISRLRGSEPPPDPAPRAIRITARASTLGRATSRLGAE